jgi:hypothetical protein
MYSDKQRVQMYINLLFDWQWMLSFINLNNNTPDQFKLTSSSISLWLNRH